MRIKVLVCAAVMFFTVVNVEAEENYYRPPMDIPVLLSANFAELRDNHFHSGIDIKTGGVEGQKVYAAADGYISRIGIAPSGYGRVLYVAHPNGTTTVYAHLREFKEEIEKYVKKERYRRHRHAVDLYPDKSLFPVKRGDFLGFSGNSGMSFGPHLHFEIRESGSQAPINPIVSGNVIIKDNIPPTIYHLHWITVDTVNGVPVHNRRLTMRPLHRSAGAYVAENPLKLDGRGYFAVEYIDTKDGVNNKFAVYKATVSVNGKKIFEYVADKFTFAETKYVNAVMEYALHHESSHDVMRLVRSMDNPLSMYVSSEGSGLYEFKDNDEVLIELEDDSKNISAISFTVKRVMDIIADISVSEDMLPVDNKKDFTVQEDGISIKIPAGALYEPIFFTKRVVDKPASVNEDIQILSPLYEIGDSDIPLYSSYNISLRCDLPEQLKRYASIARVNDNGRIACLGGRWDGNELSVNVGSFGVYCVVLDTEKPYVKSLFEDGVDLSARNSFTFSMSDNLSGVASFEATIDGKWIIFEQNMVRGTVTHYFDDELIERGKMHEFVLTMKDGCGNIAIVKRNFKY